MVAACLTPVGVLRDCVSFFSLAISNDFLELVTFRMTRETKTGDVFDFSLVSTLELYCRCFSMLFLRNYVCFNSILLLQFPANFLF